MTGHSVKIKCSEREREDEPKIFCHCRNGHDGVETLPDTHDNYCTVGS